MCQIATMLGLSISEMAVTTTTIRLMSIMFGVCETVGKFENLNLKDRDERCNI